MSRRILRISDGGGEQTDDLAVQPCTFPACQGRMYFQGPSRRGRPDGPGVFVCADDPTHRAGARLEGAPCEPCYVTGCSGTMFLHFRLLEDMSPAHWEFPQTATWVCTTNASHIQLVAVTAAEFPALSSGRQWSGRIKLFSLVILIAGAVTAVARC